MTTNFQSITESPEKLAEFLKPILLSCVICPLYERCDRKYYKCENQLVEWLQEECNE